MFDVKKSEWTYHNVWLGDGKESMSEIWRKSRPLTVEYAGAKLSNTTKHYSEFSILFHIFIENLFFQTITSKQKLRIGYFTSFPGNSPSGDTKDALRKAKYYLESCGHIVTNFEPPDDLKCQEVWTTLMKVHTHRHTLHDDDKYTFSGSNLNNNKQISPRILWVDEDQRVKNAFGGISAWQRIVGKLDHLPGRKSSKDRAIEHMHTTMNSDCDLWNTASLREQFVDEVLDSMNTINVDVVICPVFGHTATTPSILTKHGLCIKNYSSINTFYS